MERLVKGMTIKPITEGSSLSTYDLGKILEDVAKALKDLPLSPIRNLKDTEEYSVQRIADIVVRINNHLVEVEKKITESEDRLYEVYNNYYEQRRKYIEETNQKIRALPKLEEVRIPYNFEELVKVAERFSNLDDETWNKVVELAKTLSK